MSEKSPYITCSPFYGDYREYQVAITNEMHDLSARAKVDGVCLQSPLLIMLKIVAKIS